MRNILNILAIFLICNYSSAQEIDTEKVPTIKEIVQASYSAKRSGELSREDALKQKPDRKEIYNQKGIVIEYWQYETDGTIYEKTILSKDENGKLIKSSTFDSEDNLKRYSTTELDKKGNIIFFRNFSPTDEPTTIQENQYDSSDNIISIASTTVKSNNTFKTIKIYNFQNQLVEETDLGSDGSIKDVRTFKYDENNNEVESDLTKSDGDYTKFVSEYDVNKNMTVQKWYDKEGNQKHQTSFTYEYDNHNNWITKKRYSNGELGIVWERTIEYN